MRTLTLFRGMAWFGVAVVFWSLNVRWGTDINLPKGAGPWHRTVVGCGLLTFIAALMLSLSGRNGQPPSWLARGIAGACSVLTLVIAWSLYKKGTGYQASLLGGPGWTWMVSGCGMVMSAIIGTLGMTRAEPVKSGKSQGGQNKSQGGQNKRKQR